MKSFPTELIYLLIIGAILLFNYVMRQAASRRQSELPRDEPPQDEPPQDEPPQDEPLPEIWGRAPSTPAVLPAPAASVEPARRSGAPSASSPLPRRHFARRSLMGTRRDVQNAIVVTTILSPCRAYEPHDIR
jgi:hypothetical protein